MFFVYVEFDPEKVKKFGFGKYEPHGVWASLRYIAESWKEYGYRSVQFEKTCGPAITVKVDIHEHWEGADPENPVQSLIYNQRDLRRQALCDECIFESELNEEAIELLKQMKK